MRVEVFDYTDSSGTSILVDDECTRSDAQFMVTSDLLTIEGEDYQVFETKFDLWKSDLKIAVRKN